MNSTFNNDCGESTSTSESSTSSASSASSASNRLTVETLQAPPCRSQSNAALQSPNQLQGIVIESLKTPVQEPTDGNSASNNKSKWDRDAFGGRMFEPEGSSEQYGVPWMLYRQRSQSTGAIPHMRPTATVVSTAMPLTSGNHLRWTSANIGSANSIASDTGVSFDFTDSETDAGMRGAQDRHARPSDNTYRKRVHSITHIPDHRHHPPSLLPSNQSALFVSTESLNTAIRATQTMDGSRSMQFFNRQIRRVQQFRSMRFGTTSADTLPMQPSSPSNFSHSPAPSTHSASTCVLHTSTSTAHTDQTAVLGHSASPSASGYTNTSPSDVVSSPAESHASGASTLCDAKPVPAIPARGIRGLIRRVQERLRNNSGRNSNNGAPIAAQFPPSPDNSPDRPVLKELSSRKSRYSTKDNTASSAPLVLSSNMYYIFGLPEPGQRRRHQNRSKGLRVDSKCFFSNERTYMHWIKFGLHLGSMALTLLSFGQGTTAVGLQVGLFLVMVTMMTLVYATMVFHLRHRWMIQLRADVRFYDRVGPTLLSAVMFLAYATNVALSMHMVTDDYADNDGYNFYNSNSKSFDI